jgi:hypothetical protein
MALSCHGNQFAQIGLIGTFPSASRNLLPHQYVVELGDQATVKLQGLQAQVGWQALRNGAC